MTTQQLRKETIVFEWHITIDGISITYRCKKNSQTPVNERLRLDPLNSARHLNDIGSIDSWMGDPLIITRDEDNTFNWADFVRNYQLSQWDALTIAINYELEKATEEEINNGDIGQALKRLI